MTIDLSQFQQTFIEESLEGLDDMENNLLHLEVGAVDSEQINSIFRAAHSIKGGSSTFGFEHVSNFTHVLETLLDDMRDGKREVSSDAVDVLLQSVDILRSMILALQNESSYDESLADEIHTKLNRILNNETPGKSSGVPEAPPKEVQSGSGVWEILFKPHSDMMQTGNDPVRMLRELEAMGEVSVEIGTEDVPDFMDFIPENSYFSWRILLKTENPKSDIEEVFAWVEDECDLTIQAFESTTTPQMPAAESGSTDSVTEKGKNVTQMPEKKTKSEHKADSTAKTTESASIRVSIDKVDALINMVGELVITQSMLNQFAENEEVTAEQIEQLRSGLSQLERNTRELQESVMSIRMLPISFIFSRFPRMVHDLSNKLGKKVELVMSGEGTELDKTVMEKIGDPLVHLVRNAIDHGIENPDIRRENGKPESGTVNLNAFHQGGNIVIEIKDNGAGLNKDKLLAKAHERGLVEEDESLSEEQIYQLIFMPGFSTAEVVSDVSGRGVGMDVVKKNIVSLGGSIEIESELGKGTTFRVRLPLTLAILDGQTVRVGNEVYIIPLVSIMESIQIKKEMVRLVGGEMEVFKLRDEYLPIIRLHEVFEIDDAVDEFEKGLLVVVEGGGQRVGLFVDELLGQQQVVIKSLETNFRKMGGISGATILGDGSVAIIIDIPGLIKLASIQNGIGEKAFA
jgi:two-component system chemotaxis sensor kinase CheA